MFGGFKLGYEVLGVYGMDIKFVNCRSDDDFVLYDRYELLIELVMRHVECITPPHLSKDYS